MAPYRVGLDSGKIVQWGCLHERPLVDCRQTLSFESTLTPMKVNDRKYTTSRSVTGRNISGRKSIYFALVIDALSLSEMIIKATNAQEAYITNRIAHKLVK